MAKPIEKDLKDDFGVNPPNISPSNAQNNNGKDSFRPQKESGKPSRFRKGKKWKDKNRPNREDPASRADEKNQSSTMRRTPSFSTTNLSTPVVAMKYFNQQMITEVYRFIQNATVVIKLFVKPITPRLERQAEVWADKIIMSQELYLKAILSSGNRNDWRRILIQVYVYSYFVCLLYALTDYRVSETPDDRVVIRGHAILYEALLQPSFTFYCNEQAIKYDIDCTEEEVTAILEQARTYPYIRDYISTGTRFSLQNPQLDRILKSLLANFSEGLPEYGILGDRENNKRYLSLDNFAIGNSFYTSESNEIKWFYSFNQSVNLMSNSSLFGKACFFTSRDDTEHTKYFDQIDGDDESSLVKYEVVCMAASMYPDPVLSESK